MASLGELVASMVMDTARFTAPLTAAEYKLDKFVDDTRKNITKLATGIAAVFTIDMFATGIKGALDFADALDEAAQKTGMSVTAIGGLQAAAEKAGVDSKALTTSMTKLTVSMAASMTAGSDQALMFKQLGIEVEGSEGKMRKVDDVMLDVADQFMNMEDGADKTALAVKLFGKAGADLIPVLNLGRAGLEAQIKKFAELTGVTDEMAKRAGAFNDSIDDMKLQNKGLWIQLTSELLPAMEAFVKWIGQMRADSDAAGSSIAALGLIFKSIALVIVTVVEAFLAVGGAMGAVVAAQEAMQRGDLKGAWNAIKDGASDAAMHIGRVKDFAVGAFGDVSTAVADANKKVVASGNATADATAKAAAAAKAAAEAAKKAAKEHAAAIKKASEDSIKELNKLSEKWDDVFSAKEMMVDPETLKGLEELDRLVREAGLSQEKYGIGVDLLLAKDKTLLEEQKKINVAYEDYAKLIRDADAAAVAELNVIEDRMNAVVDANRALRDEISLLGLTGTARIDRINQLEREKALTGVYNPMLRDKINAYYDEKLALEKTKYAAEEYGAANQRIADALTGVVGDALTNFIENGTRGFRNMWDSFKKWALTSLAQIAAKQIVVNIAGALGLTGVAGAAAGSPMNMLESILGGGGGGGGGGIMDTIGNLGSMASNIGSFFSAGGVFASGIGNLFATSGVGQALGLAAAQGPIAGGVGLTALGTTIGAAIPIAGIAIAVGLMIKSYLDSKRGGPKVAGVYSGGILRGGDLFPGEENAAATATAKKVVMSIEQNYANALARLGGTGAAQFGLSFDTDPQGTASNRLTVGATVGGQQVYMYRSGDDSLGRDQNVLEERIGLEAQRALLAALQASELPNQITRVLNTVVASAAGETDIEGVIRTAEAVGNMLKVIADFGDPVQAVADLMTQAAASPMDAWRAQGDALTELARTVPATAAGLQELNAATDEYWKTTLQLVGAIMAARDALSDMFASTRDAIIESTLSPEQLLAREKEKLTALQSALDSATDPAMVAKLSDQINASINKIWGMLSPEEQKTQQADFLAKLDAIAAQADTKLNASLEEIRAKAQTERQELTTALERVVTGIEAAGVQFNAGANTISNVAATGITVNVVQSPPAGSNDQVNA
jgi:hypothetical protein